jgi:hypothetical protein
MFSWPKDRGTLRKEIRALKRLGTTVKNPQCAVEHPEGGGRIVEEQRLTMLLAGYWGTENGSWKIFFDRREEGAQPEGDKVGIQISALYDVSTGWAQIAAEFVEADGRPEKLQHLYNSTLAET